MNMISVVLKSRRWPLCFCIKRMHDFQISKSDLPQQATISDSQNAAVDLLDLNGVAKAAMAMFKGTVAA